MASGWLGAMPPPPGIDPNFVDPPSQLNSNIALHAVSLSLVTISLGMRLYTRLHILKTDLGWDDAFCLLSFALTSTFTALMFKSISYGIGRHMWDVEKENLVYALKWFSFASYIYLPTTASVKLCFFFIYRRIFSPDRLFSYAINFGIVFVICLNIAILLSTILSCKPMERAWDASVPGECFDPKILPYVSGVTSSVTDLYVLALPLPVLWGLKMDLKRKIRVTMVIGIGVFAFAASIVRLAMTPILSSSFDATWNISSMNVWATLEVNIGLICANTIIFPAFFKHHLQDGFKSSISRLLSSIRTKTTRSENEHSSGERDRISSNASSYKNGRNGRNDVEQSRWPAYGRHWNKGSQDEQKLVGVDSAEFSEQLYNSDKARSNDASQMRNIMQTRTIVIERGPMPEGAEETLSIPYSRNMLATAEASIGSPT